jgi:hypothetical protein
MLRRVDALVEQSGCGTRGLSCSVEQLQLWRTSYLMVVARQDPVTVWGGDALVDGCGEQLQKNCGGEHQCWGGNPYGCGRE